MQNDHIIAAHNSEREGGRVKFETQAWPGNNNATNIKGRGEQIPGASSLRHLNCTCWCQIPVGPQRGTFMSIFDIHMFVHYNVITNYSQQDATFLEFIYFYRRSTYFRLFLRPSSGAHNRTYSFRYCQPILLLAATVEEMELSDFYGRCTYFRRFLRPSSGAHNRTYSFRYW